MISTTDLDDIRQLFVRYSNMIDERQFSRLGEVFTPDAAYDIEAVGLGTYRGSEEILGFLRTAPHPLLHNNVNAEATIDADGTVRAFSRCLAVLDTGQSSIATYHDILVRTADGWRIAERIVPPRTTASIPAEN